MSTARAPTGFLRLVVLLVGLHSCVLGVVLLVWPIGFTELMGFPPAGSTFFASQSGVFLLALGICYLLGLRDRAFVAVILVSKSLAVAFLVAHAAFLDAPPIIWVVAAGDAFMLVLTLFAISREAPTAARPPSSRDGTTPPAPPRGPGPA